MTRLWVCGVLALALSGCSLPFSFPPQAPSEPVSPPEPEHQEVLEWLQLSGEVMHSSDTELQRQLQLLQQPANRDELKLALWLSHPRASAGQRQQAQQLFQQRLSSADPRLQPLLAVFQAYNQTLLNSQRQVAERQQQIDSLTQKLNELATIDEQINERRYQESAQ
ncbi:hypothetical protein C7H85_17315 [Zobellella endophytica]|uniref:Uncharacterized protein n=1 Tax=Zobellella endophytica TaxID=2116700 RepID=A0A2P7QWK9_9GAMM|nr:hypothetical protein [Zobellella endophytica]PSJ42370.1 hypothetical protein C7H85_17315 [Zobellella endophytica]